MRLHRELPIHGRMWLMWSTSSLPDLLIDRTEDGLLDGGSDHGMEFSRQLNIRISSTAKVRLNSSGVSCCGDSSEPS